MSLYHWYSSSSSPVIWEQWGSARYTCCQRIMSFPWALHTTVLRLFVPSAMVGLCSRVVRKYVRLFPVYGETMFACCAQVCLIVGCMFVVPNMSIGVVGLIYVLLVISMYYVFPMFNIWMCWPFFIPYHWPDTCKFLVCVITRFVLWLVTFVFQRCPKPLLQHSTITVPGPLSPIRSPPPPLVLVRLSVDMWTTFLMPSKLWTLVVQLNRTMLTTTTIWMSMGMITP